MSLTISTQVTTVGKLLRQPNTFSVPLYQRDYSWTKDEVSELWNDVLKTTTGHGGDHFLGAIVLSEGNEGDLQIVDGQQRIATMSILIAALRDLLNERNDKRAGNLVQFLGEPDMDTLEISPKLRLNENNNQFFADYIVAEDSEAKEKLRKKRLATKANRLIQNAYNQIYDLLGNFLGKNDEVASRVKSIVDAINLKLKLIHIQVNNDESAFLIFETLNQRGLELSISDLLKNHVFSKAKSKLSSVKKDWDNIAINLGEADLPGYLRHYWLSTKGVIREKELYRAITTEYRSSQDVIAFAKNLRASSEVYGGLDEPTSKIWKQFKVQTRQKIALELEQINLCGVTQCYPVLLAAAEDAPDLAPDVFRLMKVFAFRYSVIGSQGTGNLEKVYSDAARYLRSKKVKTLKTVFDQIRSLYPNDEEFKIWFEQKQIRNGIVARYTLQCIEDGGYSAGAVITNKSTAQVTLEHILPKSFSKDWEGAFGSEADASDFVFRLGNMALLETDLNVTIGNEGFVSKRDKAYAKSKIKTTRGLKAASEWLPETIADRQRKMAEQALKIWRFDA